MITLSNCRHRNNRSSCHAGNHLAPIGKNGKQSGMKGIGLNLYAAVGLYNDTTRPLRELFSLYWSASSCSMPEEIFRCSFTSSTKMYPPFPLLSYFSVVVCLRWLCYHVLSSITHISLGLCFNYLCSVYWCSDYGIWKRSDTLWPAGRVRLFADYTISLSSLCRLTWRHWTNKMLVRYMLPSVCLRLRLFSQLSFIQYMGLCILSWPNSPVMIVRMCTLSYYHHQIGSLNR